VNTRLKKIADRRARRLHPVLAAVIALALCHGPVFSTWGAEPDSFENRSEGFYTMGPGDTAALAECLALFVAKRKAIEAAAEYFARRKLIEPFDRASHEIYALAADNLSADSQQLEWLKNTSPPRIVVRIRLRVRLSDLIEAEIEDRKLSQAAVNESLRREMEPSVSETLRPGHDIAEGYRWIRLGAPRAAIIYLDRLIEKYPHWSEVYRVKALAYQIERQWVPMRDALRKACALGCQSACDDLKAGQGAGVFSN
jgi:hypothetical protein